MINTSQAGLLSRASQVRILPGAPLRAPQLLGASGPRRSAGCGREQVSSWCELIPRSTQASGTRESPPTPTAELALGPVLVDVDEVHKRLCDRSSSAPEKAAPSPAGQRSSVLRDPILERYPVAVGRGGSSGGT